MIGPQFGLSCFITINRKTTCISKFPLTNTILPVSETCVKTSSDNQVCSNTEVRWGSNGGWIFTSEKLEENLYTSSQKP